MKKASVLFSGLFLFGVYALPGKVCPSLSEGERAVAEARTDVPPCHRGTVPTSKQPCGKMVCCLLPDVSRGMGDVVVMPSPGFSGMVALPSHETVSPFVLSQRVTFEAQAPPGASGRLFTSTSPRGPPLA
jgi:hypothetical protein